MNRRHRRKQTTWEEIALKTKRKAVYAKMLNHCRRHPFKYPMPRMSVLKRVVSLEVSPEIAEVGVQVAAMMARIKSAMAAMKRGAA